MLGSNYYLSHPTKLSVRATGMIVKAPLPKIFKFLIYWKTFGLLLILIIDLNIIT